MTRDEALKLALEALDHLITEFRIYDLPHGSKAYAKGTNAIREIQAVLAQPEQEPVACDGDFPEGFDASLGVPAQALRVANAIMCDVIGKREWDVPCTAQHVLSFAQKYTTPPQRKPLTDAQSERLYRNIEPSRQQDARSLAAFKRLLRVIEAAHGIKGEA